MSGTSSDMSTKSRSRIFLVNLGGRVAATPALRGSMPGEIEEQVRVDDRWSRRCGNSAGGGQCGREERSD